MRAMVFKTRSGEPVMDLQASSWSYDTGVLAQDGIELEVPAYTKWASNLDLRELLTKDKHSLALIDESVRGERHVVAAGPIVTATPTEGSDGKNVYSVSCRGIERLLDWRAIRLFPGWPLLDSSNLPTGAYDQVLDGLSYGTIIKRLIQESEKFPGGDLPIEYEPDRVGVHERSAYSAINGKPILEAMDQITKLVDGVEFDFQPRIDEYDCITYHLATGTDADRIIYSGATRSWNLGGHETGIKDYTRVPDPTPVITDSVFTGGKEGDKVLLAASAWHGPLDEGYPRAELWDRSHSTVTQQATLQSWASGALGEIPDSISFSVKASQARGLRHGDLAVIYASGHWDLPNGEYSVRVLAIEGTSSDPEWVKISLM